jgi:16S rRNA (cytosine1402-N4)-methyltransferase
MQDNSPHIPVLLQHVIEQSNLREGDSVIDGTIGFGGHALALLNIIGNSGKYLGIDKDEKALDYCKNHICNPSLILAKGMFGEIDQIAAENNFSSVNFILLDLGVSSVQLDDASYGLSFLSTGALDMRIGVNGKSAADIINNWTAKELKQLFTENGQEGTNRLVDKIISERQKNRIKTVEQLRTLIESVVPYKHGINPSTKVFQALRIEANDEFGQLMAGLAKSTDLLAKGGRIVVISFHSGEDKIVKNFFRNEALDCICPSNMPVCQCNHKASLQIITKSPIIAGEKEIKGNPRSRSAKMRVAEKI